MNSDDIITALAMGASQPRLWDRIAARVAAEIPAAPLPAVPCEQSTAWQEVAPGISALLLATDVVTGRVSMMVRLQPDVEYPAHEHADLEELHLLEGELWIDERKLVAGDYNRAEAGSADRRVFSPTGCTCVLITSTRDRLIHGPLP
jgi:anti-sigma factor ChrR (cupin superfamily)